MVDGEATAEQLLQLRPHLRNCAGCRAALRELRGSNAPLAALFPVGGVALMGDGDGPGGLDAAGEVLSRLWQSLWGDLSDRAATAAFRAQSVAQAIVPGKSMAVLASAAALAGGGVAIDEAAHDPVAPRAALHVPSVSTAADRLPGGPLAPPPAATPPPSPSPRPKAKAKRRVRVRRPAPRARRSAAPAPRVPKPRAAATAPAATRPATSRAPATIPVPRRP